MSHRKTRPLQVTPPRRACPEPPRRDGWTAHRQLRFLTVLTHTRCVSLAARCVGMTRESAYRLRSRDPHGLFAHIWQKATAMPCYPPRREVDEGHTSATLAALATEEDMGAEKRAALSTS